jgi:hypothetical protein
MREDYLESLDKMFPDGYVIIYTCPNETLRLSIYNPQKLIQISEVHNYIVENFKANPGGE